MRTYCSHGYTICVKAPTGGHAHGRGALQYLSPAQVAAERAKCYHAFGSVDGERMCLDCGQPFATAKAEGREG